MPCHGELDPRGRLEQIPGLVEGFIAFVVHPDGREGPAEFLPAALVTGVRLDAVLEGADGILRLSFLSRQHSGVERSVRSPGARGRGRSDAVERQALHLLAHLIVAPGLGDFLVGRETERGEGCPIHDRLHPGVRPHADDRIVDPL